MLQQICTFFFLILVADLNGIPKVAKRIKIIGGHSSYIDNYPYQVMILHKYKHKCGGSLVNREAILTAAHCIQKYRYNFKYVIVRAGSAFQNQIMATRKVIKIYIHEHFNDSTFDFDVAILKVNAPFKLGRNIQPVRLPKKNFNIKSCAKGIVTGWGQISVDRREALPLQLQAVALPILSYRDCKYYYRNLLTPRMICAGYLMRNEDTCQGDSGGPLISNGVQVGITSWGIGCGNPGTPGVYTNVLSILDFIYSCAIYYYC